MAIITLNNRSINRSDTASADQVWTATSATASDFQVAGGKIGQVVQATDETQLSTTNASDDLISKAITPSATSSSVLVMVTLFLGTNSNPNGGIKLLRDTTALAETSSQSGSATGTFWSSDEFGGGVTEAPGMNYTHIPFSWTYLDTAISTTSATTYKFATDSYSILYYNRTRDSTAAGYGRSTITLMEILS